MKWHTHIKEKITAINFEHRSFEDMIVAFLLISSAITTVNYLANNLFGTFCSTDNSSGARSVVVFIIIYHASRPGRFPHGSANT